MRQVTMPSGATLTVSIAPFKESKALNQAILRELKTVEMKKDYALGGVYKDAIAAGFSSVDVEKCVWECFKKCLFNKGTGDVHIDDLTFEEEKYRADYIVAFMEVVKENTDPFVNGLFVVFPVLSGILNKLKDQPLSSTKTNS